MTVEYTEAEDIRVIISKLIRENEIKFNHLTPRMFLLSRRHADKPSKWTIKTTLIPKKMRHLLEQKVFQIEVDKLNFDYLSDEQKEAEVFHALCHTFLNEKGNFKIVDHDFQGFYSEVEKYGSKISGVSRVISMASSTNALESRLTQSVV